MLLFGHPGLTLGTATLLARALQNKRFSMTVRKDTLSEARPSGLVSLGNFIDIRLLLIGSLLPDIIDKPIGLLFFRNTIRNGRTFSHTLLFLFLITLAAFYVYKRYRRTGLLALWFGTLTHLIFDQMWRTPQTLFWPFYGFTFAKADITDWIANMLHSLLTNPQVYIPELMGAAILIWFLLVLIQGHKTLYFLRCGRME